MISASTYNVQAEVNRQTQLSSDIAKLQTQISTGVRLQAASDDPAAAARVAAIRQSQAEQTTWSANVDAAAATATAADSMMGNVETSLQRVQELLIQASSATTSASDRVSIATELGGIAQDLSGYAAAKDSTGQALFPATALAVPIGANTTTAATPAYADVFSVTSANGGAADLASFVAGAAARVSSGAAMGDALTTVGNAVTQLADARAAQGVRASRIADAGTRLSDSATNLKVERSGLESTDVTQSVADLQQKMTVLQAAQAVLVKLSKSNLFDLLG